MANVYIGWPNRVAEATLTGGSWESSLPRSNLATERRTQVARTTDDALASTKVLLDLGQARSLRGLAAINHNCSSAALWRITLGTTSGGSEVYSSGWINVWQMAFDGDLIEWEQAGWWEGITDDEYLRAPYAAVHVMSQFYSARYATIEFDDTANADGYLQIGRLFIGGGLVPTYNYSYDAADGWEDPSTVERGDAGGEFAVVRPKLRTARFSLDWLTPAEAEYVHEMHRRVGTTGDVLYVPDATDADTAQRYGFVGRLRALSPITYPHARTRANAFEVVEKL